MSWFRIAATIYGGGNRLRPIYAIDVATRVEWFFSGVAMAGALAAERSKGFREGWDIAYWDGPIFPKAPVHEPREGVYVKQVHTYDEGHDSTCPWYWGKMHCDCGR